MSVPRARRRIVPALAVLAGLLWALHGAARAAEEAVDPERDAARARGLEVVLPEGFFLDLGSGLVTSRAPSAATGWIGLEDGRLVGPVALRRLAVPGGEPGGEAALDPPPGAVRRGDGEVVAELAPRGGDELVFDLDAADPARGWGWLRVARVVPSGAALELVRAPAGAELLERAPRRLAAMPVEGGVELAWSDPAATGADGAGAAGGWLVWRAVVPASRGLAAKRFELVARTAAPPYVDRALEPEVLYEYRVARADVACIAARARGVASGIAGEALASVDRGSVLSLLTGATDGARVDLRVDFANQDGLQVSPGDGSALRLLNGSEETDWMLPDPGDGSGDGSYATPRTFLQAGRSFAVLLAEGVFARVVVEAGQGASPGLRWRVDVEGGRHFPQPPGLPAARFGDEGVVLDFTSQGVASAAAARAAELKGVVAQPARPLADLPAGTSIVVLREDGYGSQRFVEVLEGEPGAARLVDPVGGPPRIVRYRFLHRSGGHDSPPGEPLRVLLVDRSDEAAVGALVEQAIAELGRPDFEERARARAVLEELGTRAIDELGEALASDDPEVAGAAQDILVGLETRTGDDAPAPAALVLRARAVSLGLAPDPPLAELVDPRARVRALALLRRPAGGEPVSGTGGDPGSDPAGRTGGDRDELERWRALLAEADPDEGVRLVAASTAALGPEPWRAEVERLATVRPPLVTGAPDGADDAGRGAAARLARAVSVARTTAEARELVAEELASGAPLDAWHELALCTLYWELARDGREVDARRDATGERRALERVGLALGLLEQHAATGAGVFLEALEALHDDPWAYLMARRTFARRRAQRLDDAHRPRTVVRLAAADGTELSERLRELAAEGARDVAVLLPPGVYDWEVGDRSELAVPGLWLVSDGAPGDVLVRGMLIVQGVTDVVLVNLTVDGENRSALSVTDAGVALVDCRLSGTSACVTGARSFVQLERCELGASRPHTSVVGARFTGDGLFVARDSLFSAEGGAVQSARDAVLERCVVEAGRRNGVDGTQQGGLVLVDCLIESEGSGVSNVGRGVFEGVVFVGRAASGLGADVTWCAEHVRAAGPSGDLASTKGLERCPLDRTRR